MQKTGINPITIRSKHPGQPALTILRAGLGFGDGPVNFSVSVAVVDETEKKPLTFAMYEQEDFIDALGHLFPGGELSKAHQYKSAATEVTWPEKAQKTANNPCGESHLLQPDKVCTLGLGMLSFKTRHMVVHLYPDFFGQGREKADAWQPSPQLREEIEKLPGCMVDMDQAGHYHVTVLFADYQTMLVQLPRITALLQSTCQNKS